MDVSDQFGKVGVFFTYNGFIAILEKMAMPAVAAVIVNRIAGQKPFHVPGQTVGAAVQKDMCMVCHQGPSIDQRIGFSCDRSYT